jgi:tripartite-type tricarboxylate transporter receptor subunit TctC
MAITTGSQKPYKNFQDVLAKAKSGGVSLGNVGNGSLAHLATIVLNQAAGIRLVPVAYAGGGPLSTNIMGGHVELGLASTAAQAQHVRGGKMRALALTGERRSHTMPEVPTLTELGIPVVAHAWWGILAPAGTPRPIIDKLHAELVKAIRQPDVSKMLTETQGMDVVALSPEDTQKWISANMDRWGRIVRENNIRQQ